MITQINRVLSNAELASGSALLIYTRKKTIGRMPDRLFALAISGVPVGNQSLVPSLLRTIRRWLLKQR